MSSPRRLHRRHWPCPAHVPLAGRLVLFHGTHEHSGRYADFAAAFAARGVEVFGLDFHGHGQSTGTPGDLGDLDDTLADAVSFVSSVSERAPPLPVALFGHSLGALVCFVAAHRLAAGGGQGAPACVVLSGFAMDSESPPLGVEALRPLLRLWDGKVIGAIVAVLSRAMPMMDAVPLKRAWLTSCPEQLAKLEADPLNYGGWIRNRTAHALLGLRAQCRALLPHWGKDFSFLLVHGGEDQVCPRSAVDSLMASSPSSDKQSHVYEGLLHEVLFEKRASRERATADVLEFVTSRLAAARSKPLRSRL